MGYEVDLDVSHAGDLLRYAGNVASAEKFETIELVVKGQSFVAKLS